jgi:hypothetical protein
MALPPVLRELSTESLIAELRRRVRRERDQVAAAALKKRAQRAAPVPHHVEESRAP